MKKVIITLNILGALFGTASQFLQFLEQVNHLKEDESTTSANPAQ